MNNTAQPNWQKMERWIATIAIAFTPLMISISTFDSYILPKSAWLMFCTALWIVALVMQPLQRSTLHNPLNKPLLALLTISFLSILIQYRSPLQFHAFLNLAMFILLFVGLQRFWRIGGSPVWITRILMAVACCVALYGLLQDYGIDFATSTGGVRDWRAKVISTFGNPNFLAGYLAIFLPVAVGYGLRKETSILGFLAAVATVLLIVGCHTVTFCVGAAIGLIGASIATLLSAIILRPRIRIPIGRSLILLLTMIVAVSWYMAENPYNSHGRSLYRQAWESSHWWSGMGARQFNWKTTRIMIDENPVTGIGFGNYLAVHQHYQGLNYQKQWHAHDRDYVVAVDQPHFQILETASEIGPLGVLALCWLAIAWMKAAGQRLRTTSYPWFAWGAYMGTWVAIVHSFSSFPFHLPANTLLVVTLGSYLTVSSQPQTPAKSPSIGLKSLTFLIAALLCLNAFLHFRGSQYLRKGYESQGLNAIYYLDKSRTCNPWNHQTHFLLGEHYANQGWNRQASAAYQKAIQLQEDIQSHKGLARIYQNQRNREAAIRELERIIEINPVFPGHYRDLIAFLGESADPQRIETLTEKAESLEEQLRQNP